MRVVGVADEADLPFLACGTRVRGIRLHAEAVARAFRVEAWQLRNRTVALDDLVGARRARMLAEPDERHSWIRSLALAPRTVAAVRLLERQSVADVALDLGISTRQLGRILLAEVGLAPKAFQRVQRFQRFVVASDVGWRLADAAAIAGYADQPHLSREVQRLAGTTPARLAAERRAP